MRFQIKISPIIYIDIADDLSQLTILLDCVRDSKPIGRPAFYQEYRVPFFRYIPDEQFNEALDSIDSIMHLPFSYDSMGGVTTHIGPELTYGGAANLKTLLKKSNPPQGAKELIEQGFVSKIQYYVKRLLVFRKITSEQHDAINDYINRRFIEIYPEQVASATCSESPDQKPALICPQM